MTADCLSSCFISAFFLFYHLELLLRGVTDLYDQFINGVGRLSLTAKVIALLIEGVNHDTVFIFVQSDKVLAFLSFHFTSVICCHGLWSVPAFGGTAPRTHGNGSHS